MLGASGKLVIPGGIDPRDAYGTAVWRDASVGRFFYRDAGGGVWGTTTIIKI